MVFPRKDYPRRDTTPKSALRNTKKEAARNGFGNRASVSSVEERSALPLTLHREPGNPPTSSRLVAVHLRGTGHLSPRRLYHKMKTVRTKPVKASAEPLLAARNARVSRVGALCTRAHCPVRVAEGTATPPTSLCDSHPRPPASLSRKPFGKIRVANPLHVVAG